MIARTSVSEERIQPRTYARPSTVTSCLSSSIYPDLHAFSPLCHRASLSGFCFKHETTLGGLPLGFLVLVHISFDPQYSFTHNVQESGQLSVFGQLQTSLANDAVQILNTI